MQTVLILGSGRMAQSIGAWLVRRGRIVVWWSASAERRAALAVWLTREKRRIGHESGALVPEGTASIVADCGSLNPHAVIECTSEDLSRKQASISAFRHDCDDTGVLLSTSSSFLPGQIDPLCAGCHFFYPVSVTGCVELIIPAGWSPEKAERLLAIVNAWRLTPIVQTTATAFAANRLLLPLQAEVFRLLQAGVDPQVLDAATQSVFLPTGQLTLMQSIGLKTMAVSVANYCDRMSRHEADDLQPLRRGLAELIETGNYPVARSLSDSKPEELSRRFLALFVDTCHRFLATAQVTRADLGVIFSSVYLSDATPDTLFSLELGAV
jgi:3-hydroxybutyryl-CoA dehydrogenase